MDQKKTYISLVDSVLNSYSQVFFSSSNLFAWILLIVTFFDLNAGLSGLLAVLISNLTAWFLGFNRDNIRHGYYGFNSLLVGLGLGTFYQGNPEFFAILAFSALLTLFITLMMEGVIGKYNLPYLSVPFIFSIWLIIMATREYTTLHMSVRGIYNINDMYSMGGMTMVRLYDWINNIQLPRSIIYYFRSLGAIFFQYHLLPGFIIAIGLLLYSRIAFSLSLIGFFSAYYFYQIIGANISEISYAYIGFNFILTAIALGGYFIIPSVYSYIWVILLTPVISMILTASSSPFAIFQLSVYSLPFNLIVLLFLYALKFRERHYNKPELVVYQQMKPEKNLYLQNNNKIRFGNYPFIRTGMPFWGVWKVTQAYNGKYTHQDSWKHAWDFEIADDEGKTYRNSGNDPADYFCFNKPVTAPAEGWIENIVGNIDDNSIGEVNLHQNWGNTIVIKHGDKLFSSLSHLKKDSIKVVKGEFVKKGDIIAACGNSGRSPVPHLHMQFQSNPQIGSSTLDFPISLYLLNSENGISLKSYERPEENDLVSNIEKHQAIQKAFNFIPGQKIKWTDEKFPGEMIIWTVEADIYNNTYLFCEKTLAKAYFKNEVDVFYFTNFEGDKSSLLYYFYLGLYKVIYGFYKNLKVGDTFPVNMLASGPIKILQDFVAPFYMFIRSDYKIEYLKNVEQFSESNVELASEAKISVFNRVIRKDNFRIFIKEEAIEKIIILEGTSGTREIRCIKES